VSLFVDTSVWSLALRRDVPSKSPRVALLARALETTDSVFTTGLVLQELLQGFRGPKAKRAIISRFSTLPLIVPDRDDHVAAAELRNTCRRHGLQVGTIDALLAQLCIRHDLPLLSDDDDFKGIARRSRLRLA
jgi:predicted nucleic acid-binding protein